MDKKTYRIQGIELSQGELTLGQDIQILKLFDDVKDRFGEIDFKNLDFSSLLRLLVQENLVGELLGIILRGDLDSIDINDITNSELEEIITDFLALNAGFAMKLKDWFHSLALKMADLASEVKKTKK